MAASLRLLQNAKAALNSLYASNPAAQVVGKKARAVLVFPEIIRGGFLVGAQHGDGTLLVNGKTTGYYNTVAASWRMKIVSDFSTWLGSKIRSRPAKDDR
jgi:lipid-binding SYLF domain-containing protein